MSSYGIKLSLETSSTLGLSGYEIKYSTQTLTETVFFSVTESINSNITSIFLTKNVFPNTTYNISVVSVYSDGTKSAPANSTYTTKPITFNESLLSFKFEKTLAGNIQIIIFNHLPFPINRFRIIRYSNIPNSNGAYFVKISYETTNTAYELYEYYTDDFFSIAPIYTVDGKDVVLGETQLIQCPYTPPENIFSYKIEDNKIKIKLTSEIAFDYGDCDIGYFYYRFTSNNFEVELDPKFKNLETFPNLPVYISIFKNKEVALRIESDIIIPSNNIENIITHATPTGITVKFLDTPIKPKLYSIESSSLYANSFTKIYEGTIPEFLDTSTYESGIIYRVRILDIFDRWSDYYTEYFVFKKPVPPKNLKFSIDKLTNNISLFWDYEYDSEDYIEIKKFCISTNSGFYETIDKSYVLPLTEDLSTISVYAVDVFNQNSAEVYLQLNIPKPPDVQNFRAVQVGNIISLLWELPYYEFLDCFEIKINGWDFVPVYKTTTSTSISFEVTQTGVITYYIKAKSVLGVYSENYTTTTINIMPNFYTNNVIEYSGSVDNWNNYTLINFSKTADNKLNSTVLNNGVAEVIFPSIQYNSICRSINYTTQNLQFQTYNLYTWDDFADDDPNDPYPSNTTWNTLPDIAWVVDAKPSSVGKFFIATTDNPSYTNSNYYILKNSLYNTTNTNQLSTSLGSAYITYIPNGYTNGVYVLKNSSNVVNKITISTPYGLSFFTLVDLSIGSNVGVFSNGSSKVVLGIIKNIITINGIVNQYFVTDIEDGKILVTVKLKQNSLRVIINGKMYIFTLTFSPNTFVYGGF